MMGAGWLPIRGRRIGVAATWGGIWAMGGRSDGGTSQTAKVKPDGKFHGATPVRVLAPTRGGRRQGGIKMRAAVSGINGHGHKRASGKFRQRKVKRADG